MKSAIIIDFTHYKKQDPSTLEGNENKALDELSQAIQLLIQMLRNSGSK